MELAVETLTRNSDLLVLPFPRCSLHRRTTVTIKRRNHGRNRHNRGSAGHKMTCDGCGCKPATDKAVKRFTVKNIVDNSSMRDIKEASAYEVYTLPKMYVKMVYCVGCAVHRRIVRSRPRELRKVREAPQRRKFRD